MSNLQKAIIILTAITAAIMELIDTSIVNVALPQVSGNLGATVEDASWVITSYAIANVIIIPLTGFLGRYFGRKNYYLVSMMIFTFASYMCGMSESLWTLVFWRFIQGLGGGALISTSQAIIFDTFTREQAPIAGAVFGMGIVLGPTLGPTVGGYLIEHYHWSMMFYVNLPVGILATILCYTFIEKKPEEYNINRKLISIDYIGIALLAVGVGSLQYILERGEADDWFESSTIFSLTMTAAICLTLFVIWEFNVKQPAVNLRVFQNRTFALSTIVSFVTGIGLFCSVYLYPILVQRIYGWTALKTGQSLIIGVVGTIFLFPLIGRLIQKGVSPILFVAMGIGLFLLFNYNMSGAAADTAESYFMLPLITRGAAIAMMTIPLINLAVADITPALVPQAIAVNNMIRQLGGAFGIAIVNTYVAIQSAQHRSDLLVNITDNNPVFVERVNTIAAGAMSRGMNAADAKVFAMKMIDLSIQKQSAYLSYLDSFQIVGLFFILVFPIIFFLKVPKKAPAISAADAH